MTQTALLSALVWAGSIACIASSNIFTENFEKGNFSGWKKELCCEHSAQFVSSPIRWSNGNSRAVKFTYKLTDYMANGNTKRAELRAKPDAIGSERWYRVSLFVPKSFTTGKGSFIITQFHSQLDKGEQGKITTLFLATDGKKLTLGNRWDARKITPPRQPQGKQNWDLGQLPTERWIDYVYHIKWSYQSDGLLEVFQDGKKVVKKTGPNCYNDRQGPNMKIGIYASTIKSNPEKYKFDQKVLYFDAVHISDAWTNYQTLVPRF